MDEGVPSETEEKISFLGKLDQTKEGQKGNGNLAETLQIPFEEFTEEVRLHVDMCKKISFVLHI